MSGYATPRPEGSRLGASGQRDRENVQGVCARERCRRDERGARRGRGRGREREREYDGTDARETRERGGEGESSPRERERPLENYKLYVVPNRPSKIIPAHPAAIMNM